MPYKIPVDDLPEPLPYTKTYNGFVYVCENTIPVTVSINPAGITVELRQDGEVLGVELESISKQLTQNDVELLKARKAVKM
jgi:hypothetical protein